MAAKRILSLGQCGADHAALAGTIQSDLDAQVVAADTIEEALTLLRDEDFDLVLVNRVLEYGGSGIDFISRLKADESLKDVPIMLVSNYEDAQKEAVQRGALPGFGKSRLRSPQTVARLKQVLADVYNEKKG
jgi:two-component system chemotaxis response regulator CheY